MLVEGTAVDAEALRTLSLANVLQLVVGPVPGGGAVLHLAAATAKDLTVAVSDFGGVPGVAAVTVLTLKTGR